MSRIWERYTAAEGRNPASTSWSSMVRSVGLSLGQTSGLVRQWGYDTVITVDPVPALGSWTLSVIEYLDGRTEIGMLTPGLFTAYIQTLLQSRNSCAIGSTHDETSPPRSRARTMSPPPSIGRPTGARIPPFGRLTDVRTIWPTPLTPSSSPPLPYRSAAAVDRRARTLLHITVSNETI